MNNKFKAFMRIEDFSKDDKVFRIKGVASSTSIDSHGTIFSEACQRGWIEDIERGLPTYMESNHDGKFDFTKRIGRVTKAYTEKRADGISEFIIEAELNMENASGREVARIMENPNIEMGEPESLGLSINGYVEEFRFEAINDEIIEIYDKARLEMVGIVEYPSNPDSINVSLLRSIDEEVKKKEFSRIMNENKTKQLKNKNDKIDNNQLNNNIENNLSKGKERMSEENKVENAPSIEAKVEPTKEVERIEAELITPEAKDTNVNVTVNSSNETAELMRQIQEMTKGFGDALKSVTDSVSQLRSEMNEKVSKAQDEVKSAKAEAEEVKAELTRAKETPTSLPSQPVVPPVAPEVETEITREDIKAFLKDPSVSREQKAEIKLLAMRDWYKRAR